MRRSKVLTDFLFEEVVLEDDEASVKSRRVREDTLELLEALRAGDEPPRNLPIVRIKLS